jgi:hypothetical protein
MQVSDVWEEVKEAAGLCDETVLYRTLTRAVELLANEGLFDPLLGTVDMYVDGGYYIALPRDVKTPLRINIDNNPSFFRNRLYEFQANTNGTNEGEEVGWQWHERGYSPIQDELKLPSKLSYQVNSDADVGKTCKVTGTDADGRLFSEELIGALASPTESTRVFQEVRSVQREETEDEAFLVADTGAIGRYYADEIQPEYRVIKLSKTGVAVRMLYRKHVFKLKAQDDIIPLHSPMAVIRAVEAVRLMLKSRYVDAQAVLMEAIRSISKEQDTRDEGQNLALGLEVTNAINRNISTNEAMIVADFYDMASEILGPLGRQKLFDRINDGIEILQNKAKWDSTLGWCDIWKADHCLNDSNRRNGCGDGYFVLPRFVKAVEALNFCGQPMMPRNQWFEYHLNGTGSRDRSSSGTWDDVGNTCIINFLPIDPDTKLTIPTQVLAVPEDSRDEDTVIRIYGFERKTDGTDVEVWRDGVKGWVCPCKTDEAYELPDGSPEFVKIDRIQREQSSNGFIRLIRSPIEDEDLLLGYWYPDELEPSYRLIKVPCCKSAKIRIRYRKRSGKISGLNDIVNIRSRVAIECILRSLAIRSSDIAAAGALEAQAAQYILEEQAASNPIQAGGLQFDPGTCPALTENIC